MMELLNFISGIGELAIVITPFTLVIGIINAIKKPEKEAKIYKIMAITSSYLIIIPLLVNSILN